MLTSQTVPMEIKKPRNHWLIRGKTCRSNSLPEGLQLADSATKHGSVIQLAIRIKMFRETAQIFGLDHLL